LTSEMSRSPPVTLTRGPRCARSGPRQPGPPPQLHPGRLHGFRHLTATVSPGPSRGDARHCRIAHVARTHAYARTSMLTRANRASDP
jgi:hypothetical protein